MRIVVLLCLACLAGGCDRLKKHVDPSPAVPVITRFEFAPATGRAPLVGEFIVEVTGAVTCGIEPTVRAVACVGGRKAWTVTASGDYVLTATSVTGQSVSSSARVTITP